MQVELECVEHILLAEGICFIFVNSFLEDIVQKVQNVSVA